MVGRLGGSTVKMKKNTSILEVEKLLLIRLL